MSLQSACAKIKSSLMITVEHHFMQKLHSSAITLLQIFELCFTGSWVATVFVTSHTYFIYQECFIIHNSIATLNNVEKGTYLR